MNIKFPFVRPRPQQYKPKGSSNKQGAVKGHGKQRDNSHGDYSRKRPADDKPGTNGAPAAKTFKGGRGRGGKRQQQPNKPGGAQQQQAR